MSGAWMIEQRRLNAENSFIDSVIEQFKKNRSDAVKVLNVFKMHKIIKIDSITGQFSLKHGAFWDLNVIKNAILQHI